jgi:aspartate/methionine/tyrosine aminotransferase
MSSTLAEELNDEIGRNNPHVLDMLSDFGKKLYYPKGILTQTAEAKEKATRYNATIGIVKENGKALHLPAVLKHFSGMEPDEIFPYAPTFGKAELRSRWKEKLIKDNPSLSGKGFSNPIVTSGITHGISLAADLFVNPGDVVLLPDKLWGNYVMIFGIRYGAEILKYSLLDDFDGGFGIADFRQKLLSCTPKGKVVVLLNFPNNPTGYSVTRKEAEAIKSTCTEAADMGCNVVVICDDSYYGLFYEEDVCVESLSALLADHDECILTVKLDGATKEDFVWGFRTGFITFSTVSEDAALYNALEQKCAGAIRGGISNCSHPSQSILLKAMQDPDYKSEKKRAFSVLRSRMTEVKRVLGQDRFKKAWKPYPFNSGYFMCLKLKNINAETFRIRLLKEYSVGVVSTSDTDIRVAFSCIEESQIEDLFNIMFQCASAMETDTENDESNKYPIT